MLIFTALLPVLLLLFYIYKKDKYQPEPAGQILKAFGYGILSVFIALGMSAPMHVYVLDSMPVIEKVRVAFLEAAIPEEGAKLFMLWSFLRKNRYFDERMDGVVYAVCVSLGFAGVENICYLFHNYDNWLHIGVARALFAVPGHFGFGVLMGYYYSLVTFSSRAVVRNRFLLWFAPILAHGLYDFLLLMVDEVHPVFVLMLIACFLVFCHRLQSLCRKRIDQILKLDEEIMRKAVRGGRKPPEGF